MHAEQTAFAVWSSELQSLGGEAMDQQLPNQESPVSAKSLVTRSSAGAETPVADVEQAPQHYRDALGFEIGWLYQDKEMEAVSRETLSSFFRGKPPFEPAVHWVFADDIDASANQVVRGKNII